MSAFFNKVFKGKDSAGSSSKKSQHLAIADVKSPQDEDPWLKTEISPEEISELLRLCTKELKLRGWYYYPCGGSARQFKHSDECVPH